jgi:RimJ/RimL family protein N-acetyltransferase
VSEPFDEITWPVRTDRLVLRPATPEDAEAIWRYRRLEEVTRWISRAHPTLEDLVRHGFDPDRPRGRIAVEHDGELVGDVVVLVGDGWSQAEVAEQAAGVEGELGWVFDPRFHGRGLATEAVRELLRLCFEELGLRRVTAGTFADNEPSWRLMERVGMRRESHAVKDSLHRTLGWLDGFEYAMLAEEWPARGLRPSSGPSPSG